MTMTMTPITYKDAAEALAAGARFCYIADHNCMQDENGIVPSAVFENTPGHYPMLGNGPHAAPWYWGTTVEAASAIARHANAERGLSEDDVKAITLSSVLASIRPRAT